MNLNDRTAQAIEDTVSWFPHLEDDVSHAIIGLCGEAGEAAGEYKKWYRSGAQVLDTDTRTAIGYEIVDVFVYAFCLAGQLGIDLEDLYDRKRKYNEKRFGSNGRGRSDSPGRGAKEATSTG